MLRSFFRIPLSLFALLMILVSASNAIAHLLTVEIRTSWLPGDEFIAAQAIIASQGLKEILPVFTNTPAEEGFRIAEFKIPSGEYTVEINLLRPDATVLDSKSVAVNVEGTSSFLIRIPRTPQPDTAVVPQLGGMQTMPLRATRPPYPTATLAEDTKTSSDPSAPTSVERVETPPILIARHPAADAPIPAVEDSNVVLEKSPEAKANPASEAQAETSSPARSSGSCSLSAMTGYSLGNTVYGLMTLIGALPLFVRRKK